MASSKVTSVRDLPIYDDFLTRKSLSTGIVETNTNISRHHSEAFPGFRETVVSPVRQKIWDTYESAQDTRDLVHDKYAIGRAHTQQAINYIKDDANVVARGALITVGGLAGLLLGARGGPVRKVLYTGVGMGSVASLCYPEQAVQIGQVAYCAVAQRALKVWNDMRQDLKSMSPAASLNSPTIHTTTRATTTSSAPIVSEQKPVPRVNEVESIANPNKMVKITAAEHADFGQSNPADRDMYTTRGTV